MSLERVLWDSCVRVHPYEQQLDAALAGGFSALSMPPHVALANGERGLSPDRMRTMATDRGLTLSDLDGGIGFMPITLPTDATPRLIRRFGLPQRQALDLAAELGVRRICTVGLFDKGTYSLEEMVDGFGQLCDAAAELGIDVSLEPMAFFGVCDLGLAADIVARARRPNAAILFDTWHFSRSRRDISLLPELHASGSIDVQINDGAAEPQGASLMEDSTDHRMLPGDGTFEVVGLLEAIGPRHIRSIGVEVFSTELDSLPAVEAGRQAGAALRAVAAAAGIDLS